MKPARMLQRGASLPETALVMGILLTLIFGIIEFGRVMYTYSFVAQLARQGARWAIVRGSQCTLLDHCNAASSDVQTYVRGLNEGATNANNINVTATWPSCPPGSAATNAPGCTVSVNVKYTFNFLAPIVSKTSIAMSSTSLMVISQ